MIITSAQNDIVSGLISNSSFWEDALAAAVLARLDAARTEALAARPNVTKPLKRSTEDRLCACRTTLCPA